MQLPREPRTYLPSVPAHIVQRSHNCQPCFFKQEDYIYYNEVLGDGLQRKATRLLPNDEPYSTTEHAQRVKQHLALFAQPGRRDYQQTISNGINCNYLFSNTVYQRH